MMNDLNFGDYVCIIYTLHGTKRIAQGYVRHIDKRYIVLGVGFRDEWVKIERVNVLSVQSHVSRNNLKPDSYR